MQDVYLAELSVQISKRRGCTCRIIHKTTDIRSKLRAQIFVSNIRAGIRADIGARDMSAFYWGYS